MSRGKFRSARKKSTVLDIFDKQTRTTFAFAVGAGHECRVGHAVIFQHPPILRYSLRNGAGG